jgi:hypothetical protein
VASIIERIDLGYASNPMRVFISLTAALCEVSQEQGVSYSCKEPLS